MTDAELLDGRLEGSLEPLPERLLELAAVAAELAVVLRAPRLSQSERDRILRHAAELASARRHRRGLRRVLPGQPALLAAGAGSAAALTVALVGLALLRRSHPAAAPVTGALSRAA